MGQPLFYLLDHQSKSRTYMETLVVAGYKRTWYVEHANFVLFDLDVLSRVRHLEEAAALDIPIILYPHSGRPQLAWDGIHEPFRRVDATCVASEGHKEVLRAYGYPHRLEPMGWSYCPLSGFRPSAQLRKILFAPIHANANGWLHDTGKRLNQQTMEVLVKLKRDHPELRITVRYLKSLKSCGLEMLPGFQYVHGLPNLAYQNIEDADLIISHQTFAYLAVARGKPTVMMGEWETPLSGNSLEKLTAVSSWEKYRHLMMFPLDILATDQPWELLQEACQSDKRITDWRARMIGEPFQPQRFLQLVKELTS